MHRRTLDQPDLTCTLDQLARLTPTTRSVHIKEVGFFLIGPIMTMPFKGTSHAPHAWVVTIVHNPRVAVVTGGAQGLVKELCADSAIMERSYLLLISIEGANTRP